MAEENVREKPDSASGITILIRDGVLEGRRLRVPWEYLCDRYIVELESGEIYLEYIGIVDDRAERYYREVKEKWTERWKISGPRPKRLRTSLKASDSEDSPSAGAGAPEKSSVTREGSCSTHREGRTAPDSSSSGPSSGKSTETREPERKRAPETRSRPGLQLTLFGDDGPVGDSRQTASGRSKGRRKGLHFGPRILLGASAVQEVERNASLHARIHDGQRSGRTRTFESALLGLMGQWAVAEYFGAPFVGTKAGSRHGPGYDVVAFGHKIEVKTNRKPGTPLFLPLEPRDLLDRYELEADSVMLAYLHGDREIELAGYMPSAWLRRAGVTLDIKSMGRTHLIRPEKLMPVSGLLDALRGQP